MADRRDAQKWLHEQKRDRIRARERAVFEAQCAARLQAEAERKAAEAVRTSMRAPPEDRWRIAPRWWLDGGGTQERWEEVRAERYCRNADAQTPPTVRTVFWPVGLSRRQRPLLCAALTRTASDAASFSGKCVMRAFAQSALLSLATGGRVRSAAHCSSRRLRSQTCAVIALRPALRLNVRWTCMAQLDQKRPLSKRARRKDVEAYARGYVDYGDVDADPY